jgi:SOS-response transcriptional repressor LexA
MIPFEEIDVRLAALDKDRKWLAEATGRSPGAIRSALAPRASAQHRSELLQKALTDAILAEEERQKKVPAVPALPERVSVQPTVQEFQAWCRAYKASSHDLLEDWMVAALNQAAALANRPGRRFASTAENLITFPEIPLLHAAAGFPIDSDADTYMPTREVGPGRFAVQLHGDSMAPRYPDGRIVILRERASLKRPTLKKGEIYLFDLSGEKTLKVYGTRYATPEEIEAGITYTSQTEGTQKVILLKSLNPAYPDIVAGESVTWLGWLDKADQ